MKAHLRMLDEEPLDILGLMRRKVVEHDVDFGYWVSLVFHRVDLGTALAILSAWPENARAIPSN